MSLVVGLDGAMDSVNNQNPDVSDYPSVVLGGDQAVLQFKTAAAAASFYGTWLVSDAVESPHLNLAKIKGEVHIACAEYDDLAPMPMVRELQGLFTKAGTAGEIEIYPGVYHGFAFPQRWCYQKQAAEKHWERLIALYRKKLA